MLKKLNPLHRELEIRTIKHQIEVLRQKKQGL